MSKGDKEVVTAGVCKLITDATNMKIDANRELTRLQINDLRDSIKAGQRTTQLLIVIGFSVATAFLAVMQIIISVMAH